MADNLLGSIFSAGNRAKKRVNALLRRPEDFAAMLDADAARMYDQLQSGDPQQMLEAGFGPGAMVGSVAGRAVAPIMEQLARVSGTQKRSMLRNALADKSKMGDYITPTVENPQRVSFPDAYLRPDALVARANVAPEDPLMKQLFGVTRDDLYQIAQEGRRAGNAPDRPFKAAANPKGSSAAEGVMNPKNAQRLIDIVSEARKRPDLFKGMSSWYTMDPAYQQFVRLYGPERAAQEYARFNTLSGMASPGSEVLTELNRGTAANWLDKSGRFDDFLKYGGGTSGDAPADMAAVLGHPYHKTAQGLPMQNYLQKGTVDMTSAKVPSYIAASGVPETGFQTQWPVGDAHWSRLLGLPDVRTAASTQVRNASATVPEMVSLAPWFRDKVAAPAGLEAVPAQAVIWGGGSNATGVTSPIGAPKLELLAQQIGKTAQRLGVSPEQARDMVLMGQTHAGFINPKLLMGLGAAGAGGTAIYNALSRPKEKAEKDLKTRKSRVDDAIDQATK